MILLLLCINSDHVHAQYEVLSSVPGSVFAKRTQNCSLTGNRKSETSHSDRQLVHKSNNLICCYLKHFQYVLQF